MGLLLLFGLEFVVRDAQRLEVVQISRASRREWHDVVKLERPSVLAEGALVPLALHDESSVRFRNLDPFEACDPEVVSELGETLSLVYKSCTEGNRAECISREGYIANHQLRQIRSAQSDASYLLRIVPI